MTEPYTVLLLLVTVGQAPFQADIRIRSTEQGVICLSARSAEEFHRACWVRDARSTRLEMRTFLLRSAGEYQVVVSLDGVARDKGMIKVQEAR